jgi:hypothetical protein
MDTADWDQVFRFLEPLEFDFGSPEHVTLSPHLLTPPVSPVFEPIPH